MKYLFYNEVEFPLKYRIKSKCFGLDIEYDAYDKSTKYPCLFMKDLFDLAKCQTISDVQIYCTWHLEAYVKDDKKSLNGFTVEGWISLKEVKNGGGYLKDSFICRLDGKSIRMC